MYLEYVMISLVPIIMYQVSFVLKGFKKCFSEMFSFDSLKEFLLTLQNFYFSSKNKDRQRYRY